MVDPTKVATIGAVITGPEQINSISTLYRGERTTLRHLKGIPRNWSVQFSAPENTTGEPLNRLFHVDGANSGDDTYVWVRYSSELIRDEEGNIAGEIDGRLVEGWGALDVTASGVSPDTATQIESYIRAVIEDDIEPREVIWRGQTVSSTIDTDDWRESELSEARRAANLLEATATIELQNDYEPERAVEEVVDEQEDGG